MISICRSIWRANYGGTLRVGLVLILLGAALPGLAEERVRIVLGTVDATDSLSHGPDLSNTPLALAIAALTSRLGYRRNIEVLPVARAFLDVRTHGNVVMLPMVRTPQREDRFRWLVWLWDDDCVMVTYRQSSAGNHASSQGKIGTVRASANQEVAELLGLTDIDLSIDDVQNVRKLASGRIAAWFSMKRRVATAIKLVGMDPGDFQVSPPLRSFSVYVAASANFPPDEAARWTSAGDAIRAEGVQPTIFAKK